LKAGTVLMIQHHYIYLIVIRLHIKIKTNLKLFLNLENSLNRREDVFPKMCMTFKRYAFKKQSKIRVARRTG